MQFEDELILRRECIKIKHQIGGKNIKIKIILEVCASLNLHPHSSLLFFLLPPQSFLLNTVINGVQFKL